MHRNRHDWLYPYRLARWNARRVLGDGDHRLGGSVGVAADPAPLARHRQVSPAAPPAMMGCAEKVAVNAALDVFCGTVAPLAKEETDVVDLAGPAPRRYARRRLPGTGARAGADAGGRCGRDRGAARAS